MERQTLASPTLTSPSKGHYNDHDHSIKPETRYLKKKFSRHTAVDYAGPVFTNEGERNRWKVFETDHLLLKLSNLNVLSVSS